MRVTRVCDDTGIASVEIQFEDMGALWDLAYEEVGTHQFKKGSVRASAEALGRIEREADRPPENRCFVWRPQHGVDS